MLIDVAIPHVPVGVQGTAHFQSNFQTAVLASEVRGFGSNATLRFARTSLLNSSRRICLGPGLRPTAAAMKCKEQKAESCH